MLANAICLSPGAKVTSKSGLLIAFSLPVNDGIVPGEDALVPQIDN